MSAGLESRKDRFTHPVIERPEDGISQSAEVCRELRFGDSLFAPSIISISPYFGQFDSEVSQAAGHVPQP